MSELYLEKSNINSNERHSIHEIVDSGTSLI